ncbi:hypothetical protein GCM10011361_14200 [Muriicola marianensis]|uniref:Uncharacterized protein n=1 Tax=Muriicola marianensis TaxID=1324801 RepID=A0ABQ1QY09_9FLAO|nr:hypothetical protein GCM10011361_14200 [Muriicola marianensis]
MNNWEIGRLFRTRNTQFQQGNISFLIHNQMLINELLIPGTIQFAQRKVK